jgi:integrase
MQGIRRKLGAKPHQKAPLTLADMRKLISTLAGDDLRAVRDRALLLVGYAGAFRRSELVALTRADVRFKQGEMVITLQRSKTDQEGAGSTKTIPSAEDPTICPVVAMRAWLNAAEVNSGHVFRAIDRWGHVRNGQMQGKEVARIVKKACEAAGIDAGQFGGHSLRAGFITTAAEGGAQQWQIAEISGHKPGSKVLEQYIRTAGRGGVRAAKLAYGESGE